MGKVHKLPEYGDTNLFNAPVPPVANLWALDIGEVTGHNLEVHGREEVNRLLGAGWLLLHIYTLTYREDDTWRERPMAILGRPRKAQSARLSVSSDKRPGQAAGTNNISLATMPGKEDAAAEQSTDSR